MSILLVPIVAPVFVSPLFIFLSDRWRRGLLFIYLMGLLLIALLILRGLDLSKVTLLSTAFQTESGFSILSFSVHPYGRIAAFGFSLVGSLGLLYGLKLSSASEQVVAIWAIASALGVAFADNFLTFLLFWELLSLSAAALVYLKKTSEALRMATRMLVFQLIGGFALTIGIVHHYLAVGSFALATPAAGLPFFILGIGIKTAFIPLHLWVPWGYPEASFPSSVLLAALCTKVGVYGVARILPHSEAIALMGACMAIIGVSFALIQGDLRRLLSYHIISQVGYMVAGVGLGSLKGIDGGLLHLVNHMIYKALLFMSAGALILATGTENLHKLHHPEIEEEGSFLWRTLPIAAIGAVVGALSIAGVPPFNGYVSKYLLKYAADETPLIYWIMLIASVGTSLSFAKFVYFGFIKGRLKVYTKLNVSMQAAIIALSACCILFGVKPELLEPILPHQSQLHPYSLSGVLTGLGLTCAGILLFSLLSRQLEKKIVVPPQLIKLGDSLVSVMITTTQAFWSVCSFLLAVFTRLVRAMAIYLFRLHFRLFQRLDYRPGRSTTFRTINFGNIDFDIMLIILIFGAVLFFLFYLQFGTAIFPW